VDKNFNQDEYCKKWVDSGAAQSCAVCFIADLPEKLPDGDNGASWTEKLKAKSEDCLKNQFLEVYLF
jgi:hypothetical protein